MASDNSGALFTVENRESDDTPYASGKMTLLGNEYYLDAWKIVQDGADQLDMQFKAKGSSRHSSDGEGELRRNEKSKPTHPDWKGQIKFGSATYKVAGWRKKSAKGLWYLSLAIDVQSQPAASRQAEEDPNEGHPF